MKKNISINIGGIIFHIEEDGFDKLKNYLDTINRYFSDFKDSQEIINDIENRIAEIFLTKLKEDKQVIGLEDVNALMVTLGSIEDFKKAEETDEFFEPKAEKSSYEEQEAADSKKLFRDTKRNVFGGVAAGIAHYFNIDMLWIRLAFIVGFFGLLPFQPTSGIILIAYILLWIFLPSNPELVEDEKVKKLYRSQENKVIGGVARGLASYFGTDVAIIRILFVLLLLTGGAGLLIYLVLWFIAPTAKTVTQKMQMEGTPITLSNIEKNIKSSLKVEEGEENILVKILLFPFRLIALILNGLGKALGPVAKFIVDAVRVLLGIVLSGIGLFMGVTLIILLFLSQGIWYESAHTHFFDIPTELIVNTFSLELLLISFLFLIIPSLLLIVSGISVIAGRWLMNKTVAFSILAIWFLSFIGLAIIIPTTGLDFKSEGEVVENQYFEMQDKTAVLKLNEVGFEDYEVTSLKIRGYEGDQIMLEKKYKSQGSSRMDAENNSKMIYHHVVLENDSILSFDSNIRFLEDAAFRAQSLDMTLYVPYGQEFEMDRKMKHILRNTIYINGFTADQIDQNRWVFEENEGLNCLTCTDNKSNASVYKSTESISFFEAPFSFSSNAYARSYEVSDFNEISGATAIFLEIRQGSEYSMQVVADKEDDLEHFQYEVRNGELKVYFGRTNDNGWNWNFLSRDFWNWRNNIPKVKCIITLPELRGIELSSASYGHILGFTGEKLDIEIESAASLFADVNYQNLELDVSSASRVNIKGRADRMNIEVSSAARVEADHLIVKEIEIDASSASRATVHATDYLKVDASSAASVNYKGKPKVESSSSSGANVSAD